MFRKLMGIGYGMWRSNELKSVTKEQFEKVKAELLKLPTDDSYFKSSVKVYGHETEVIRLKKQLEAATTPAELMASVNSPFNKIGLQHTTVYYDGIVFTEKFQKTTWNTLEDIVDRNIRNREPHFDSKSLPF